MWSIIDKKTKQLITGWDNLHCDPLYPKIKINFKNIMTIEYLNYFYDGLYNYNNTIFLEILK